MRRKLTGMATGMNLDSHMLIHGPVAQQEVPRYVRYADAGILAFPDHEWWNVQSPLKLFEYLAMAKPVIVTDIPMNKSVVGDSPCAFLIRDNSPEQIAAGIRQAIADRASLTARGVAGRALVEKEYTWSAQAHKIIRYLDGLR